MQSLDTIDFTNEAAFAERGYPWQEWDQLRKEAPVYWYHRPNYEPFWALTKYEDVAWVAKNPHLFSCGQRVQVETPDEIEPFELERQRRAKLYGHPEDYYYGLPFMDPPNHRLVRQAMYPAFSQRGIAHMKQRLDQLALEHVADFERTLTEQGSADVAHDLASRLPLAALFQLLGVPDNDWDYLFTLHHDIANAFHPEFIASLGENAMEWFMGKIMALDDYMSGLVTRRMTEPPGEGLDVLTGLMKARLNGEPLKPYDLGYIFTNLVHAGNGTSRNAIAGGVEVLLQNPDQLQKLVDDPGLLDSAVEEILRWTSVAIVFARVSREDVEIRGQKIRRGQTIAMVHPSANRDEDVFENPYTFDITRNPNRHFTFGGFGEHRCIGAALARMELRAMFSALLPLLPKLELLGKSRLHVLRMVVAEYAHMRVGLRPTRG